MSSQAAHTSHKKQYIIIFVALAVLTILEIWIAEIKGISTIAKGSSLTLLAVGKAALVAYYYMHLNEEGRWLKFIAAIPVTAAIYATVLCLEVVYHRFI